jgi:predicted DsbA family dithiol-disulfide isomerase
MTKKIKIELFSANACSRCFKAKKCIKAMIDEFGNKTIVYRELDVLEELDYAVALGILATPAIAIDGELIFSGMPSINRLQDEINKRLA